MAQKSKADGYFREGPGKSRYAATKLLFFLIMMVITSFCSFAVTDILFLVDTTGSMTGIDNVKTIFNDIITAIETDSCPESIMFGLADYRNRVDGLDYETYGVNLDHPFTNNVEDMEDAIEALSTGNGGDAEESQLKAFISIVDNWLTSSGDLDFHGRAEAQKMIIWTGDQPGHDEADDYYYPALNTVINSLTAQGITVFALNPSGYHYGLDELYNGHYQASEITTATGGMLFNNVSSASPAIIDAVIDEIVCVEFTKDDDLDDEDPSDCRQDGEEIEYTVSWTNISGYALADAWILDRLPTGVTYPVSYILDPNTMEVISSDPAYDPDNHEYVWYIGQIPNGASGSVSLTVVVNSNAVPGMNLINIAELYDGESLVTAATEKTLVCCPENPPSTIYVDKSATGANSGMDWANAYNSLDDALTQARESVCVTDFTILVAQGTYAPQDTENGFVIPDNVSVYGGFPTGGCDFAYRNPKRYETILTGLIDEDEFPDATKVVTMGDETVLDGFIVTNALEYGVYGNGVDFTLSHCIIKNNFRFGIYAENGNVSVQWTTVNSNGTTGIQHTGSGYSLTIDNSWILRNGEHGIFCLRSTPYIKNSIISESAFVEQGRQGIHIEYPTHQPKLYNLTIANNKAQAIYFEDDGDVNDDPNKLDYPDLQNSILYFNNNNGSQVIGFNPDLYANFCCIQDCNSIGTTNYTESPEFAYMVLDPNGLPDPSGAPDPNNYHLAHDSFCIDKGNSDPNLGCALQVDFDNELRVYGEKVDIGADEVYDCDDDYLSEADVHNKVDWNADGIVGLPEFTAFSRSWLSRSPDEYGDPNLADPNEVANWNPACNLADTGTSRYVIDLADLEGFVDRWLWAACWRTDLLDLIMQPVTAGGGGEMLLMSDVIPAEAGIQAIQPELTIAEQILQLQDVIAFLEQIWLEDPQFGQEIDPQAWQEFLDTIYQELADLQTKAIQI